MIIRNVTEKDLYAALAKVNERFDNNIEFANIEPQGRGWKVRLTVKNSNKKHGTVKGARLGQSGLMGYGVIHHIKAACWHVHGYFFDALPRERKIIASRTTYKPGENWENFNIGSTMYPVYCSEACDCER